MGVSVRAGTLSSWFRLLLHSLAVLDPPHHGYMVLARHHGVDARRARQERRDGGDDDERVGRATSSRSYRCVSNILTHVVAIICVIKMFYILFISKPFPWSHNGSKLTRWITLCMAYALTIIPSKTPGLVISARGWRVAGARPARLHACHWATAGTATVPRLCVVRPRPRLLVCPVLLTVTLVCPGNHEH